MSDNSPSMSPSVEDTIKIRRGRVASVDVYEIKENELDQLEAGSPAGLQLNFAIFLFSTAITAIVSICTATFINETIKTTFILVAVVGVLLGLYLIFSWHKNHRSIRSVIKAIRARIPQDPVMTGASTPKSQSDLDEEVPQ